MSSGQTGLAVVPISVRGDIECQQTLDRHWGNYHDSLQGRLAAVLGARRAFMERQIGAQWELRQSLVDLASVCELLAEELPRPTAATRRPAQNN